MKQVKPLRINALGLFFALSVPDDSRASDIPLQ